MMALVPLLAGALIFLLKNPLKVASAVQAQDTAPGVSVSTVNSDVEITWEIPPLYQPGGRDPMQLPAPPMTAAAEAPAGAPTQTNVELIVTGILYSADRPAAIVDTQLVHEGDQVSGATVKKIGRDGVEFEMNGRTWKQVVETQ